MNAATTNAPSINVVDLIASSSKATAPTDSCQLLENGNRQRIPRQVKTSAAKLEGLSDTESEKTCEDDPDYVSDDDDFIADSDDSTSSCSLYDDLPDLVGRDEYKTFVVAQVAAELAKYIKKENIEGSSDLSLAKDNHHDAV